MHFGQCVLPYFLSTLAVYLHATKTRLNVVDQYYFDYTMESEMLKILSLADRLFHQRHVSIYKDNIVWLCSYVFELGRETMMSCITMLQLGISNNCLKMCFEVQVINS